MALATESNFQSSIRLRAQQSSRRYAYPGTDLLNLTLYLRSHTGYKLVAERPTHDGSADDARLDFAVIQDLGNGSKTRFGSSLQGLDELRAMDRIPQRSILFIRGFASPECLNIIGEKFGVTPELCRRHLSNQPYSSGFRDLYTSPPLLSSSTKVFQLTIPTICARDEVEPSYEPEDLRELRSSGAEAMDTYFKGLRKQVSVADSVVRNCLFLSKQQFVIEQTVSIEIGPSHGPWQAVVWLDSGKDLSQSPDGPWSKKESRTWDTYFFPVIAQSTLELPAQTGSNQSVATPSTTSLNEDWRTAQNICLLPSQYGAHLDRDVASQDAIYALSEVLRFAAAAEVQFLNLLSKRLGHELSLVGKADVGKFHTISLLNLRYIKSSLKKHVQSFTEVISVLQNRDSLDLAGASRSATSERMAQLLLADFEDLQKRAADLSRDCDQGMATLANITVLEEARRSAGVATRVQRLTLMATVFIPLAFVSSVWGMNFKEMGSGDLSMWWWAVSATPVLVLALLIYKFAPGESEGGMLFGRSAASGFKKARKFWPTS